VAASLGRPHQERDHGPDQGAQTLIRGGYHRNRDRTPSSSLSGTVVVVDYQMNKACAPAPAASSMSCRGRGRQRQERGFARLAFEAPHHRPRHRCAAFVGQAVASAQQGAFPGGHLRQSGQLIAGNYLSKFVETRKLGDKVILTGASSTTKPLSPLPARPRSKSTIVPEHKESAAPLGAALLARSVATATLRFQGLSEGYRHNH